MFGDEDNFPKKKRPDLWAWVITFSCLLAVMVSAVLILSPSIPLGK